jgi:hypothetical protein
MEATCVCGNHIEFEYHFVCKKGIFKVGEIVLTLFCNRCGEMVSLPIIPQRTKKTQKKTVENIKRDSDYVG